MALTIDPNIGRWKVHTLDNNERRILEFLKQFRNPYRPLDAEALEKLNKNRLSIDKSIWICTVEKLQESGYIHGVTIRRNAVDIPHDQIEFLPESYITYKGIMYMYEYEWPKPDDSEKRILEFLIQYRNPDQLLDGMALDNLNRQHLSIDEMDWPCVVGNLCQSGYIKNVTIAPGNDVCPYGVVEFLSNTYITQEGIMYLRGTR